MENKQIIIVIALLLVLVGTSSIFFINITGKATKEDNEYKIGVILPMSGHFAFYGEKSLEGIKLAVKEYSNIKLIVEDDKGELSLAVSAAQKLINIDNVDALITIRSSISSAVAPIAEQNKVIMLYSSTVNTPAEDNKFVFKNFMNIESDCEELSLILKEDKGRLIGHNLDSTQACISGFQKQGIDLKPQFFNKDDNDFRTQLTKIKKDNPDYLVIRGDEKILPLLLKQLRELDIQTKIICPQTELCQEDQLSEYPEYSKNAIGTSIYEIENSNFHEPIDLTYASYEDAQILAKVLSDCKGDENCMINELKSDIFNGVDGIIEFNDKGVSVRETALMKFENGKWQLY